MHVFGIWASGVLWIELILELSPWSSSEWEGDNPKRLIGELSEARHRSRGELKGMRAIYVIQEVEILFPAML
jgi:hypothetical protein